MSTREQIMAPPVECTFRCGWQWPADGTAERRRAVHEHARHDVPLPPQEVTGATWQERARNAVEQVAARGRPFTIFEALAEFGLQSPPDHQHRLGKFATLMHDLGVAHPTSAAPSMRTGTKKSQAAVWHRSPTRCVYPRCRVKAGAR